MITPSPPEKKFYASLSEREALAELLHSCRKGAQLASDEEEFRVLNLFLEYL